MIPLKRFVAFIQSPSHSRTLTALVILVIAAAVPLTVLVAQQQQEVRQHAAESCPTYTGTGNSADKGVAENLAKTDAINKCKAARWDTCSVTATPLCGQPNIGWRCTAIATISCLLPTCNGGAECDKNCSATVCGANVRTCHYTTYNESANCITPASYKLDCSACPTSTVTPTPKSTTEPTPIGGGGKTPAPTAKPTAAPTAPSGSCNPTTCAAQRAPECLENSPTTCEQYTKACRPEGASNAKCTWGPHKPCTGCTHSTPTSIPGTTCKSPNKKCGTICTNVNIDPKNCGQCGYQCDSTTPICNSGSCSPASPAPSATPPCGVTCPVCDGNNYCTSFITACGQACTSTCAACANNPLPPPSCVPTDSCESKGYTCGSFVNSCGKTKTCGNCGACTSGGICNGNKCSTSCTPTDTCASHGYTCGSFVNSCGATITCGYCGSCLSRGQTCNGNSCAIPGTLPFCNAGPGINCSACVASPANACGSAGGTHQCQYSTYNGNTNCISTGQNFNPQCATTCTGTNVCNSGNTCVAQGSASPSPTSSYSTSPSPSGSANPSPSPTATPVPGNTYLALVVGMDGVGKAGTHQNPIPAGTQNPVNPQRKVYLTVHDSNNNEVPAGADNEMLTYDSQIGLFKGLISVGTNPGITNYIIKVKSDGHLAKLIPGIQIITAGIVNPPLPRVDLTAGDINGDNIIDIKDYNILLSCMSDPDITNPDGGKLCSTDLTFKTVSDLDDNGTVDKFDYNLFLGEYSVQNGD